MGKQLHPQIQHGPLPHPGQQYEAAHLHDEAHRQHAHEARHQGPGALHGAGLDEPVDEPKGELGWHHLQHGPGDHQHQQANKPRPVGFQVFQETDQQRVTQATPRNLITLEKGLALEGHEAILPWMTARPCRSMMNMMNMMKWFIRPVLPSAQITLGVIA